MNEASSGPAVSKDLRPQHPATAWDGSDSIREQAVARTFEGKAYLVGSGIASLACAAFLIRDGGVAGERITVLEAAPAVGGSLDGTGSLEAGYVIRGGRMMTDEAYRCTYDLLSSIPSLNDAKTTLRDEMREFNEEIKSHSTCRLVKAGKKIDAAKLGLSNGDRFALIKLMALSEESLGGKRLEDYFQASFFRTNFGYMWATMFAFQPWHSLVEFKRYLHRFIQEFPRIDTLAGVRRTRFNQYDSIVLPLTKWLEQRGVRFLVNSRVTDLAFKRGADGKAVERIRYLRNEAPEEITLDPGDTLFVTVGSMTGASSLGSMTSAPKILTNGEDASWALWERISKANSEFGNPAAFNGDIDGSKWISFTTTLCEPIFFQLMERFTGNKAGTGGLVTLTDSAWLISVVLPYQPHFLNQPKDVDVFWGYALFADENGNYVDKKMSECTGEEIMIELLHHLRFDEHMAAVLSSANCIPCMMPFITSQFMPRAKGDRPEVVPTGTANLAFIGEFCEMPDDVVFTVEYAVRSAQTAVYSLLKLNKRVPPIYKGLYDARVVLNALRTMMR